ncbi:MAG TPA: serine hydrolase domain-containing protein [Chitinophagaceae bacterium]|nr:serine hydrolase domain-containing protein [Chitinophagaceae bacterium]
MKSFSFFLAGLCLHLPVSFFPIAVQAQKAIRATPYFDDSNRIEKIKATQAVVAKMYQDHAAKNNFPGFVYGIVADGKLVYSGSVGYTNVEKKILASTTSAFRIASMSKSFTALAIVQLRDAGKLKLDEPASTYIPEMKKLKYAASDAPAITVRHLMTHSAGFPEDNPWGDRQLADTDKELLDLIQTVSFSNVPGVAYEYSNLGFALLGKIITNVSGKPYQQYINENVLKPLGMNNTYWEYTKVPGEKLALGYRWLNNQWIIEPLLRDGSYGAMGGLMTTIEDFTKYMDLHLSAWPPKSGKENNILKRSSLREMQTTGMFSGLNTRFRYPNGRPCALATVYAYGLGWTKDCEGKVWVGHSGGLPGFGSQWRMFPDYGIGVVAFANLTYAPTGTINLAVLDTIIKMADLKPRAIPVSPILEQRKNELVKLLPDWKNAEKSGFFAENFFPDNPVDSLRKQSIDLFAKAGKILSVKEIVPENNLRGSFLLEGEKANLMVMFTLTPENPPLIQEYHIWEVKK